MVDLLSGRESVPDSARDRRHCEGDTRVRQGQEAVSLSLMGSERN